MTVGQIQRNYIQQNSVGVGFFGYSGFSGFSGQAGVIGLPGGAILWIDDVMVFDSQNGATRVRGSNSDPYWRINKINNLNTVVGPIANWKDGVAVPGFNTKVRARALLTAGYITSGVGEEGVCYYALRLRRVTAISVCYGIVPSDINPLWTDGYSDPSVLIYNNLIYYGTLVGTAVSAVFMGASTGLGTSMVGFSPSGLETPFTSLPGDGDYMVEVQDWHLTGGVFGYGWVPDKIFVEFAKVKT